MDQKWQFSSSQTGGDLPSAGIASHQATSLEHTSGQQWEKALDLLKNMNDAGLQLIPLGFYPDIQPTGHGEKECILFLAWILPSDNQCNINGIYDIRWYNIYDLTKPLLGNPAWLAGKSPK